MSEQSNVGGEVLNLAAKCPCGHAAHYHPSLEQQRMYLDRSNGRYAAECKGREGNRMTQFGPECCRCSTDREAVSAFTTAPAASGAGA